MCMAAREVCVIRQWQASYDQATRGTAGERQTCLGCPRGWAFLYPPLENVTTALRRAYPGGKPGGSVTTPEKP